MPTDAWGVYSDYVDARKRVQVVPAETIAAIRDELGAPERGAQHAPPNPVRILFPGDTPSWLTNGRLMLEDGTEIGVREKTPPEIPFGYHRFRPQAEDSELFVIATPGKCVMPPFRGWGWSAQLYSLHSKKSWGIGDLGDLSELAKWSAGQGASVILVNPLHAVAPTTPEQDSPYSPTSRRFGNPLYLRIEDVPGANRLENLEQLAQAGRELCQQKLIDRTAVFRLKNEALEILWSRFGSSAEFEAFKGSRGQALAQFALYCVLAEQHGPDWRKWPQAFRDPKSAELSDIAEQHARRIDYHRWLQWLFDIQHAEAAKTLALMQDLPVGVDPGGADAWCWQDVLAGNMSLGLPPDIYNAKGQNWGLPPWLPHKLRAAGYQPLIETIRAALTHAGGLRIDHALGLFRTFWIPNGMEASKGGFVEYPHEELLAIFALESERAKAFIVAEDLGPQEEIVRDQLAKHQMLSYRLLWFEKELPSTYPKHSVAAVTTHDLPTISGLWTGEDLKKQLALNLNPDIEAEREIRDRIAKETHLGSHASVPEVIDAVHGLLANAASTLVLATMEDGQAVVDRPNIPSTAIPTNWRQRLPQSLEEFEEEPLALSIAQTLREGCR